MYYREYRIQFHIGATYERKENQRISSIRITIENIIRDVKVSELLPKSIETEAFQFKDIENTKFFIHN